MASIILASAANAIAGSFGFSAFATAAFAAGAGLVGSIIDNALFAQSTNISQEGPRLDEVRFQGSSEGTPIHRLTGRTRVAGNVIWTTKYREEIITTSSTQSGGKGGGGGVTSTSTEYKYYVSFAVGVCEGVVQRIDRIWADGSILDQASFTIRKYKGTETQNRDSKILEVEGAEFTSAYRGIAYVVFEEMLLENYGNRIPQLNVEVYRSTEDSLAEYEDKITATTVIPSAGEFVYATTEVFAHNTETQESETQNNHSLSDGTDWEISMDQLGDTCSNMQNISLVVAWHGTDLRVGDCELRPKVEAAIKTTRSTDTPIVEPTALDIFGNVPGTSITTDSFPWKVSGIERASAEVVSLDDEDRPNLGGAPSDLSVYEAIQDIDDRGWTATFYPFILMDIPSDNTLTDPYGGSNQAAFPWRGRITLEDDSDDQTAAARTQVNTFFGNAARTDFGAWDGETIPYTGPAEWSFRRMILHYAHLCSAAGGVDTFIIGSEMVSLNRIRDNNGDYPSVDQWIALAADVKAILGSGTTVTYAADWSEWTNHRPSDGSNDVFFHLDDLWADSNIDVIGIDNYMPLADWRDGDNHLDGALYRTIYDLNYLKGNIKGGEGYDWFYATAADRYNQVRTPIDDTAHGEDWVFRPKDLENWWSNAHHNRPGGVRDASPTAWVPESKPIWFTEVGCPCVDKGANQPNVFVDPKSSESFTPYFSSGTRDDFMARQFNIAQYEFWADNTNNPSSGVYAGRMLDVDRMYLWTWDARPFPEFPFQASVWSDGDNWELGHWGNGRWGLPTLRHFVEEATADFDVTIDASQLHGLITGYVVSDTLSARDIIQPLMALYSFDAFESEGVIKFKHRGADSVIELTEDDLVYDNPDDSLQGTFKLTRGQLTESPGEVRVKFITDDYNYKVSSVPARRRVNAGKNVSESSFNVVMSFTQAQSVADTLLIDAHVMRERGEFKLPPSLLALDASDVVNLTANGRSADYRLEELGYEFYRPSSAVRTEAATYSRSPGPSVRRTSGNDTIVGLSKTVFLDLPLLTGAETPYAPWIASSAAPWPGSVSVFRSSTGTTYTADLDITVPTVMGVTTLDFGPAEHGYFDNGNVLQVTLNTFGTLQSLDDLDMFTGANLGALYNPEVGEWEIVQWSQADLVSPNTYDLSRLLRGQLGTEHAISDNLVAGATFVVLEETLRQSNMPASFKDLDLFWRYGPTSDAQSSGTYITTQFTPRAIGLRPLSPCSVSATKDAASNDILLEWIRRSRIGGEVWDGGDVPLSETVEAYEIDVYDIDGTTILRTIEIAESTTTTYTSAQQTTDFGASVTTLDFEVYQISESFGRGIGRREQITFRF